MNFRVGQKVVCINDSYRSYCAYPLKKGAIYTIYGFYTCDCGSHQVFLDEIPGVVWMGCRCDRIFLRRQSYYSNRFRPLKYYTIFKVLFEGIKETPHKTDIEKLKFKAKAIYNASFQEYDSYTN